MSESEPLRVGSTVWLYGYHPDPNNLSGPWTGQYKPWPILGETPRRWLVRSLYGRRAIKLNKKRDLKSPQYLISAQEVQDAINAREEHVRMEKEADQLSSRVKSCRDAAVLKQIAALVGYNPTP